ncbi:MAG: chorismate synthase [Eubacterium sp.]|nr:chorismate synthase [Eubacterium sp.]
MSSEFKAGNLSVNIFGESHGTAIGVVIDGLPAGEKLDFDEISRFMARRAPKKDGTSTRRSEPDIPEILSGVMDGVIEGIPLCAVIKNTDQHSNDYKSVSHLARPGHSDYTGYVRYNGSNDLRGGGHFSGRLTAPLCFAGAVAAQLLKNRGIETGAHILKIKDICDEPFDPVNVTAQQLETVKSRYLPLIDETKDQPMRELILNASENLDSVGGVIEYCAIGMPVGIGNPMFDGLENRIAQSVFGVPAVKGIEFGAGFDVSDMYGSENNDEFYIRDGKILTRTNNHGGILGGISGGMPITVRAAIKPTPSISRPQKTVDYTTMTEEELTIKGRHDPCIVPRAVPCIEAAVNIALLSYFC